MPGYIASKINFFFPNRKASLFNGTMRNNGGPMIHVGAKTQKEIISVETKNYDEKSK